jgi:hypothetical protein
MASDEVTNAAADETTATVDASAQELDSFNNDVRLRGIKTICEALTPIQQKKAIMYFSAGMSRNGSDNQVELRAATNACKRSNTMLDTVDARGLQAVAPFGGGRQGSRGGNSAFSGAAVRGQFAQLAAQQETLTTLASDTGGTAFTDSNDFGDAFTQVMKDISSYYIIGYSSTNNAQDGHFRQINVRIKNAKNGYHLDKFRGGYYADRDFAHTAKNDREAQITDQLYQGLPATDVPVFLTAGYFRLATRVQNQFPGRGGPGGPGGPGGRGGGPGGPGGRGGANPLTPMAIVTASLTQADQATDDLVKAKTLTDAVAAPVKAAIAKAQTLAVKATADEKAETAATGRSNAAAAPPTAQSLEVLQADVKDLQDALSAIKVPAADTTGKIRQPIQQAFAALTRVVPRDDHNFYVPISITVPGSAIPVSTEKVTLDIRGYIQDERRQEIGLIKDTLTVPPMTAEQLKSHPVLYQTGMVMGPGRYTIKVVVRENTSGLMGTFEALATVPDMTSTPVRVSSVVLSTQLHQMPPNAKPSVNPLIHDGIEIVPNLTHVVSKDQKLYFYYEVYDPAGDAAPQVRTSLAFYRGRVKAFETAVVERKVIDSPDRHAAIFEFEVPASSLKTGLYTCQVNVVDEIAGKFVFPRLEMYVR